MAASLSTDLPEYDLKDALNQLLKGESLPETAAYSISCAIGDGETFLDPATSCPTRPPRRLRFSGANCCAVGAPCPQG
jgi:hypothetical protein